jgi:hypothetical protein
MPGIIRQILNSLETWTEGGVVVVVVVVAVPPIRNPPFLKRGPNREGGGGGGEVETYLVETYPKNMFAKNAVITLKFAVIDSSAITDA